MGAHENRWQEEEGETGEKRAGGGSPERVGRTRNSGSYATYNAMLKMGSREEAKTKKGRNGRWEVWTTLSTNYY